jgi:hypothetical protein
MKGIFAAITFQILIGITICTLPVVLGYRHGAITVVNMSLGSVVVLLGMGFFQYQYRAGRSRNRMDRRKVRRALRPPLSVFIDPPTLLCPLPSEMEE